MRMMRRGRGVSRPHFFFLFVIFSGVLFLISFWHHKTFFSPENTPVLTYAPLVYLKRPPCSNECTRLVLIKTHKTGSSTLANIFYRFGEERGLKFMLPKDDLRLGICARSFS